MLDRTAVSVNALEVAFGLDAAHTATLTAMQGDASTRSYVRARWSEGRAPGPQSVVLMHWDESLAATAAGGDFPFLNVHGFLSSRGLPVPQVYHADLERRFIVLEDLGDETFEARFRGVTGASRLRLYERAVDLLIDMQDRCEVVDVNCVAFARAFDFPLLRAELAHFDEWGLMSLYGPLDEAARTSFETVLDRLALNIASLPKRFAHRDFQSRNLMWLSRPATERLVLIDFQDALLAPRAYDLVALLCDSYIELADEEHQHLLDYYTKRANLADSENFEETFWSIVVQRKLKDAGRFVFLDRVRKKPSFLQYYPSSLRHVGRALRRLPRWRPLADLLEHQLPGFPDAVPVPLATSV